MSDTSDDLPTPGHSGEEADPGDEVQLAALEADLEAVASALSTLDRIAAEGPAGEAAAAEIAAVVSPERFAVPEDDPHAAVDEAVDQTRSW